nr:hypothetical protein [Tanacetum cinerariifolium]
MEYKVPNRCDDEIVNIIDYEDSDQKDGKLPDLPTFSTTNVFASICGQVKDNIDISITKEKEEVRVEDVQMDEDYNIDHSNTKEMLQWSLTNDPFIVCMELNDQTNLELVSYDYAATKWFIRLVAYAKCNCDSYEIELERAEVYYECKEPFKSLKCLWVRSKCIAATWLEKVVTPLIEPAIKGFAAASAVLKPERLKVDRHAPSMLTETSSKNTLLGLF